MRKTIIMTFTVFFCLALLLVSGCSYITYRYKLDSDQYFSFSYVRNNRLHPFSRVIPSTNAPAPPQISRFDEQALISVDVSPKGEGSHIDFVLAFMKSSKGVYYFKDFERGTIIIDSQMGEYIRYRYDAYDTYPVSYEGILVSLVYKDIVIDVDILSSLGNDASEKAYNLFVKTFKISS